MDIVKFFHSDSIFKLQEEVNNFIKDKFIISVSYSTSKTGYSTQHYCCIAYKE